MGEKGGFQWSGRIGWQKVRGEGEWGADKWWLVEARRGEEKFKKLKQG